MRQRRSPCVQNAGHADPCAEPLGIGRDRGQRLGRCPKQQVIDGLLVPVGDLRDLGRQGENPVEIFHGQQIRGPPSHPIPRRRSLALRTVPVLAGIIGMWLCPHLVQAATCPPSASVRQASIADMTLSWVMADMPGIGLPPRGPMGAKDVSDLQRGPGHVTRALLQSASERLVPKLLQRLERADRAADRLGGNVGIDRGGIEPGMPEQDLNDPDIGFASRRCVAKLCRNVCSVAGLPIPAMFLAEVKARLSCRGEIGLILGLPGNSQPCGRASRQ